MHADPELPKDTQAEHLLCHIPQHTRALGCRSRARMACHGQKAAPSCNHILEFALAYIDSGEVALACLDIDWGLGAASAHDLGHLAHTAYHAGEVALACFDIE